MIRIRRNQGNVAGAVEGGGHGVGCSVIGPLQEKPDLHIDKAALQPLGEVERWPRTCRSEGSAEVKVAIAEGIDRAVETVAGCAPGVGAQIEDGKAVGREAARFAEIAADVEPGAEDVDGADAAVGARADGPVPEGALPAGEASGRKAVGLGEIAADVKDPGGTGLHDVDGAVNPGAHGVPGLTVAGPQGSVIEEIAAALGVLELAAGVEHKALVGEGVDGVVHAQADGLPGPAVPERDARGVEPPGVAEFATGYQ